MLNKNQNHRSCPKRSTTMRKLFDKNYGFLYFFITLIMELFQFEAKFQVNAWIGWKYILKNSVSKILSAEVYLSNFKIISSSYKSWKFDLINKKSLNLMYTLLQTSEIDWKHKDGTYKHQRLFHLTPFRLYMMKENWARIRLSGLSKEIAVISVPTPRDDVGWPL